MQVNGSKVLYIEFDFSLIFKSYCCRFLKTNLATAKLKFGAKTRIDWRWLRYTHSSEQILLLL